MATRREAILIDGVISYKCNTCHEIKGVTQFRERNKPYANGDTSYHRTCKTCEARKTLSHYYSSRKGNIHRTCAYRYNLKTNYGLSEIEFQEMYKSQDGRCKICDAFLENIFLKVDGKRLAIDHCHTSGKVRGMLCMNCNSGIGLLGDTYKAVQKGADYLKEAEENDSL